MSGEAAAEKGLEQRGELKEELWPSMKKYFTDTQRPHLVAVLEPDLANRVREKVRRKTGGVSPYDMKEAVEEALRRWVEAP
jgi:hypothetical protein